MRVAAALILFLFCSWGLSTLVASVALGDAETNREIARIAAHAEDEMAVLTTTWKWKPEPDGPCLNHTVSTTQQQDETPEEHTARHARLVRLALIEHPAVPESSCP